MLTDEDFNLFKTFRIRAMGEKLKEILEDSAYDGMTFEEKVKEMLDAEANARTDRKIAKLNKEANFKIPDACVEEIIYLPDRNLDKDRITRLASCKWIDDNEVLIIISKTGGGKSYLCQALGNAACRSLHRVLYTRLADLCDDLNRARVEGGSSYYEKMDYYKHVELLILDDFMTTPIRTDNVVDLFEIIEARERRAATLLASQLEPNEWYLRIEGELMADSILNRIATASRYMDIEGPNMREYLAKLKEKEEQLEVS